MSLNDYPDVLTIVDVMEILQISRPTVYKLIQKNEIASRKIGSQYRIKKTSVEEYLAF